MYVKNEYDTTSRNISSFEASKIKISIILTLPMIYFTYDFSCTILIIHNIILKSESFGLIFLWNFVPCYSFLAVVSDNNPTSFVPLSGLFSNRACLRNKRHFLRMHSRPWMVIDRPSLFNIAMGIKIWKIFSYSTLPMVDFRSKIISR